MTGRPHVVILHRWRARYAEYERYLDHDRLAVTYVSTAVGAAAVPANAAEVVVVTATDDLATVRDEVRGLAERHGDPSAVIALKEDDLLVAARLAAEWGVTVRSADELLPFRDKLVMARAVERAGIRAPGYAAAPDRVAVERFAAVHGWPVVVKPRLGCASAGVHKLDGPAQLHTVAFDEPDGLLVQTYDPHDVYHVDGVFDGRALGPWRASRYLDTCLGFRTGRVLGSVEEDAPTVNAVIGSFALAVLHALTDRPTVFHLEVFVHDRTSSEPSCTFLEIGARVGGSEIAFLWRELHGYDLMGAAVRLALGLPVPDGDAAADGTVGGWLLVPAPETRPCRIAGATPMVGRSPGPYAEVLPHAGDVLPAVDSYYEHVGGRFRFRGTSSAAVRQAVEATARDFRMTAQPCEPHPPLQAAGHRRTGEA